MVVKTDAEGRYSFTTIKPGAYGVDDSWTRPPHIHYKVSRRGFHAIRNCCHHVPGTPGD